MSTMRTRAVAAVMAFAAGMGLASQTNLLSFAYSTSVAASATTPDTWGRKLNDGYWTNSVLDGVRYDGASMAVTLDLAWRTQVSKVDVYTFTVGGGAPLSTQDIALEWSNDSATWIAAGALSNPTNNFFTLSPAAMKARYLRLTCSKGASAVGQSLAEVVVAGTSATASSLSTFTYTASIPSNLTHADSLVSPKLTDGLYTNGANQSVQYGAGNTNAVVSGDPTNCVASNVVIRVAFDSVKKLRRAHVFAFYSNVGYVTESVTLSNSLDGVNWTCAGLQTNVYEALNYPGTSTVVWRYDFILPNIEVRYLSFACRKGSTAAITRQLLGEIQVFETAPVPGDPLAFTYEFDIAPSNSLDKAECPKLTDGTWESNTRNAVRFYGDVKITADLGAPRYVVGADLLCWSNKFGNEAGYYNTGRVVVNGSLDKTNWTQLAEVTKWSPVWPYHHVATFTNMPYSRYLRFDAYRCVDTPSNTNTAQIISELTIYRPPATVLGTEPAEVSGVITNAGFETPQIPDGSGASMLVKGGSSDGWTFSYADTANYAGYQRNNSSVSSNYFTTHYFAPEGYQTAVLMGSGTMQTTFSLASSGSYTLQFRVNSTIASTTDESGGYDFRVRLDGANKGVVTVLQLTNTVHQVLLTSVAAGPHTLRFEGINSKSLTRGALLDDLKLKRYEVPAEQVASQGRQYAFRADTYEPLLMDFDGTLIVKEIWLEGALMQSGKYSVLSNPAIFDGPGAVRYDRGTLLEMR